MLASRIVLGCWFVPPLRIHNRTQIPRKYSSTEGGELKVKKAKSSKPLRTPQTRTRSQERVSDFYASTIESSQRNLDGLDDSTLEAGIPPDDPHKLVPSIVSPGEASFKRESLQHGLWIRYESRISRFFSWLYLRDHCSCSQCRHPLTKQRLVNTFALPEDINGIEMNRKDGGLEILWSHESHRSFFDWAWLYRHAHPHKSASKDVCGRAQRIAFFDSSIKNSPPTVEYKQVMESDDGVRCWTSKVQEHGFCYVDGCPPTPEATKALLERISFIRETHYGKSNYALLESI